ncbi:MAG TPA: methylated-DNA--[protein]-cysteine S-methyltransferase [Candidatus Saccharimonadales bacterium]
MEHIVTEIFNKKLIVVSEGDSIIGMDFYTQSKFAYYLRNSTENKDSELLISVVSQLQEYAKGQRQFFDLKLKPAGTEFQKSVWSQVIKIPYGQTTSYLEIAKRISRPRAYRAVANAVGKNPITIIIPCHRIIRENGDLGGYSGGVDIKKLLLLREMSQNNSSKSFL